MKNFLCLYNRINLDVASKSNIGHSHCFHLCWEFRLSRSLHIQIRISECLLRWSLRHVRYTNWFLRFTTYQESYQWKLIVYVILSIESTFFTTRNDSILFWPWSKGGFYFYTRNYLQENFRSYLCNHPKITGVIEFSKRHKLWLCCWGSWRNQRLWTLWRHFCSKDLSSLQEKSNIKHHLIVWLTKPI